MDLTVEGKAFVNGSLIDCCIGVKDGKISEIKKILKGDKHINFGNKLILPAGIDLHVHFRDPGMTHKEDFLTGSMAAAFGGISCVFDMPNTIPQTTTLDNLTNKIKNASKKSFIDFGIYAAVSDNNINNIEKLAKKCSGFKIFLGATTNVIHFNKNHLNKAFREISKTNKIVLIHAEDESCLRKNKVLENNLSDHIRSRPSICEEMAIKDVLTASEEIKSKIHICHISSCEGLESLREKPNNISCGVTPFHSLLSIERNLENQTLYKVNPPIRSRIDRESVFDGLKSSVVDIIESDHAPHSYDEKCVDFNDAPTGMPGVETMFPLYLYLAKKEILSLQKLILLMCETPAKLIDIPKGKIEVGKDADFVVVDLKNECKIKSDNLHSKCDWSPFEGWSAIFPTHVFVRGEKLIEDHEIQVKQGFGRFVGA